MSRTSLFALVLLAVLSTLGNAQVLGAGCPIAGMTVSPYGSGCGYTDFFGTLVPGTVPALSGTYDPASCELTLNLNASPGFIFPAGGGQAGAAFRSGQFLVAGTNTAAEPLPSFTGSPCFLLVELGEILNLGVNAGPALTIPIPPYIVPDVDIYLQYFPVYDFAVQVLPTLPPQLFTSALASNGLQLTTN